MPKRYATSTHKPKSSGTILISQHAPSEVRYVNGIAMKGAARTSMSVPTLEKKVRSLKEIPWWAPSSAIHIVGWPSKKRIRIVTTKNRKDKTCSVNTKLLKESYQLNQDKISHLDMRLRRSRLWQDSLRIKVYWILQNLSNKWVRIKNHNLICNRISNSPKRPFGLSSLKIKCEFVPYFHRSQAK